MAKYKEYIEQSYSVFDNGYSNDIPNVERLILSKENPIAYVRLVPYQKEFPYGLVATHNVEIDIGDRTIFRYFRCPKATAFLLGQNPETENCDFCNFLEKVADKIPEAKKLAPKHRIVFSVVDIRDIKEGKYIVKAFPLSAPYGKPIADMILNDEDLLDYEKGKILKITKYYDENGFPKYLFELQDRVLDLTKISGLIEGIEESSFSVEALFEEATAQDIEKVVLFKRILTEKKPQTKSVVETKTPRQMTIQETKKEKTEEIPVIEDSDIESLMDQILDVDNY